MGLFNRKDWNVIAVIFERQDLYQVSGQRAKGAAADKARDGAKSHPRTIYWAAFDQKGAFVEGGPGPGEKTVTRDILKQMDREIRTNRTVLDVLKALETKAAEKLAKPLAWSGYPRKSEAP
ncbi:MAG: hypothetical protein KF861_08995 [Planctomycetaceae bacterium]|nr:hypothetical protein [Planctomycetaceae bacterium]